jgi:hypothetical protein
MISTISIFCPCQISHFAKSISNTLSKCDQSRHITIRSLSRQVRAPLLKILQRIILDSRPRSFQSRYHEIIINRDRVRIVRLLNRIRELFDELHHQLARAAGHGTVDRCRIRGMRHEILDDVYELSLLWGRCRLLCHTGHGFPDGRRHDHHRMRIQEREFSPIDWDRWEREIGGRERKDELIVQECCVLEYGKKILGILN